MNHELADDPHDRLVDVLLEEALRPSSSRAAIVTMPTQPPLAGTRARWFALAAALLGLSAVVATMWLREEPRSVAPVQQPQDPANPPTPPPWQRNAIANATPAQFAELIPQLRWLRLHYTTGAGPGSDVMVALEDTTKVQALAALLPASMLTPPTAAAPGQPEGLWLAWELADGRHVPAFVQRRIESTPPHAMTLQPAMPQALEDALMQLHTQAARQLRLQHGIVERVSELAELPTSVTSLRCPMLSRSDMPALDRLRNLTHLSLLGVAAPDAGMLGAALPEVPMGFAADLATLPKLQHLQLLAAFCDDRAAGELAQLPHLVSLRLDHSVKGARGGLGLSGPGRITIDGMRALAAKLTALELRGLPQPDAVYELFLSQAQLQRFACFDCELPSPLVARFARLPTLRELGLGPCTGEHLAALAGSRLERLELANVTAAAADFAALPKSLRELDLRRSGLAAAELGEALAKLLPHVAIRWPGLPDPTELPELAPTKRAPR